MHLSLLRICPHQTKQCLIYQIQSFISNVLNTSMTPATHPQSMHLSSMFPRVTPHFLCPRLSIICPRSFSVGCSNILPNNYRVHLDLLQLPQKNKTKKQQQVELWHEQTVTNSLLTQNNCRYTLICMKKTTTKNHLDK